MTILQDTVEKVPSTWFDQHWSLYGLDKEAQKKILDLLEVKTGLIALLTFTNKSAPISPSDLIEKLVSSGIAENALTAESEINIMSKLGIGIYELGVRDISGKTYYQIVPFYLNPGLVPIFPDD